MADTIERELKYRIIGLPTSLKRVKHIKQYYFNPIGIENILKNIFVNIDLKDIVTYRFRIVEEDGIVTNYLTLKTKGLFERNEYEKIISDDILELLFNQPINTTIIKNRYVDIFDNFVFEFDEYLNLNIDLFTVEIELDEYNFDIKSKVESILKNHYNTLFIDVTNDSSYKNANLIKKFGEKKI